MADQRDTGRTGADVPDAGRASSPDTASGAQPTSRVDDVEDRLVTAIAIGEYLPGTRLPAERELAAILGAGRMTVRAALARLVDRGLIETQRGRGGGSFVRAQWSASSAGTVRRTLAMRWAAMQDVHRAIALLHGALALAAAEQRTDEDAARITERLEAFRTASSGLDAQHADALLHAAIIDAARNDTLRVVLLDLESQLSIAAPAHLWGEPDGMAEMEARALHEHEDLVAAVLDGRGDDASAIAREHVGIDLELVEQAMRRAAG